MIYPCLYCDNGNESEHFICSACGAGMCEDCYNQEKGHDLQCFDFQESIEDDELYAYIVDQIGFRYGYMCYADIERFKRQLSNRKKILCV